MTVGVGLGVTVGLAVAAAEATDVGGTAVGVGGPLNTPAAAAPPTPRTTVPAASAPIAHCRSRFAAIFQLCTSSARAAGLAARGTVDAILIAASC